MYCRHLFPISHLTNFKIIAILVVAANLAETELHHLEVPRSFHARDNPFNTLSYINTNFIKIESNN